MSKKTFKDAPALAFISTQGQEKAAPEKKAPAAIAEAAAPAEKPPKGYKLDPRFVECKTRRVQLLLKPSTYEKAHDMAAGRGISLNELITQLIEGGTQ